MEMVFERQITVGKVQKRKFWLPAFSLFLMILIDHFGQPSNNLNDLEFKKSFEDDSLLLGLLLAVKMDIRTCKI